MKVKKRKLIADIKKLNPNNLCQEGCVFDAKGRPWLVSRLAVNAKQSTKGSGSDKNFRCEYFWHNDQKLNKKYGGDSQFWRIVSSNYESGRNKEKGIKDAIEYIKGY